MRYDKGKGRVITLAFLDVVLIEQFIIDTFTRILPDGSEQSVDKPDQIGGGGTYAIIGARAFLPPFRLGLIVDYTPDTLPQDMWDRLKSYGEEIWAMRLRTDGAGVTRAVNRYEGELRGFAYLTPPLLLHPLDLLETHLVAPLPTVIHFISFPERAKRVLSELAILAERSGVRLEPSLECGTGGDGNGVVQAGKGEGNWSPVIVWEPEPPCTVVENLPVFEEITPQLDIISPNHTEALSLFDTPIPSADQLVSAVETACRQLLHLRPRMAAIIRAGPLGACYALASESSSSAPSTSNIPGTQYSQQAETEVHWVPPYFTPSDAEYEKRIVDPTGAGNAFMGGVCAAIHMGLDVHEGVIWGSVAASFAIEQDGLPHLSLRDGKELWNGEEAMTRVEKLKMRLKGNSHSDLTSRDALP